MALIEQRRRFVVYSREDGIRVKGPSYAERTDAELFAKLVDLVRWQLDGRTVTRQAPADEHRIDE